MTEYDRSERSGCAEIFTGVTRLLRHRRSARTQTDGMPSTASLELDPVVLAPVTATTTGALRALAERRVDESTARSRPLRHRPRRESTATTMLRSIDDPEGGASRPPGSMDPAAAPRWQSSQLRLRDLAATGGAATLAWLLIAHLHLLGTATGTFLVSVVSAISLAVTRDMLDGAHQRVSRAAKAANPAPRRRPRRRTSR